MIHKHSIFVLLGFYLVILVACDNGKSSEGDTGIQKTDSTLYKRTGFQFPKLVPQAEVIVKDWPVFKDFKGVSVNLGNSTLNDLKRKSNNLLFITDSLSRSLPDTLKTPPIISRIAVVKTRTNLLYQEVHKGRPDSLKIKHYMRETEQSIANFVLQINEKIQKDNIDLLRRTDEEAELKKLRKTQDSFE